jgi:hypothetical protein
MPFAANEVLIPARPLDSPAAIKSLAGDVSSKLGQAFKDSYKHTRPVPIAFSKAEKLKDSKKLKDKAGLKWQVKVDSKAKAILFQVTSGATVLDEATIFDKFKDIVDGNVVISLDGEDRAVDTSAKKMKGSDKLDGNYAKDGRVGTEVKLGPINGKKKIVLVGHGSGPDVKGDELFKASQFGGRSAREIVDFLIGKGLAQSYSGTIYLCGCHTASGGRDPDSFASQVHKLFAGEGYKKLKVAGTPGETWVKDGGGTGSIPDEVGKDLKKTHKASKAMIDKLEAALKSGEDELGIAENQMKLLEMQYESVRELILDVPPEARDTLEEKLLAPIKKNRDALVPAVQEMRKANKTLEGAIRSEKAYFADVDKLMKEKTKLEDGTITESDYNRKEEELFTVEDWWGHFGPAKATTAKVKKSGDGFGKLITAFKAKFRK